MIALLWSAIAVQFALIAASLILAMLANASSQSAAGDLVGSLAFGIGTLAFPTVGALILIRRPSQLVGRLLGVVALGWALANAGSAYASYALASRPGTIPGAEWALWLSGSSWTIVVSQGVLLLLLLVYPTGALPSASWRPIAVLVGAWAVGTALAIAFAAGSTDDRLAVGILNPVAAPEPTGTMLRALAGPLQLAFIVLFALAAVSLVLRFRSSRGIERQQLKWMAAAAIAAAVLVGTALALLLLGLDDAGATDGIVGSWLLGFVIVGTLSLALLPIAIGIAILRYRLYDIDVLINRTLVYGGVSALLAATYLSAVVLFQALLRPFTSGNELSVAGSTLLVVALFQPLRRRVQGAVDRRFYRSRYDATHTLDVFAMRLRDEVDLDSVRADLLDVVRDTVRPAHASVWLRERAR